MYKSFKSYLAESEMTTGNSLVGVDGIKYQLPGGYIDIKFANMKHAPRDQSVVDFVVEPELQGRGIGKQLLAYAKTKHPDLGAQVSSAPSVKVFYDAGFRNPEMPDGSFADHEKRRQEDSSIFMALRDQDGKPYVG